LPGRHFESAGHADQGAFKAVGKPDFPTVQYSGTEAAFIERMNKPDTKIPVIGEQGVKELTGSKAAFMNRCDQ